MSSSITPRPDQPPVDPTAGRGRRFAITAVDRYLSVLEAFVAQGWTPVKLFTTQVDGYLDANKLVIARALALKMEVQISRLDEAALRDLAALLVILLLRAENGDGVERTHGIGRADRDRGHLGADRLGKLDGVKRRLAREIRTIGRNENMLEHLGPPDTCAMRSLAH